MKTRLLLCLIVLVSLCASAVYAIPVTWTGGTNQKWSKATNWSTGAVPGALDDVIIPIAPTRLPTVDIPSSCQSLTILNTVNTNITLDAVLTVSGSITISNAINVKFQGASSATFGGALIAFNGSSIDGTATLNFSAFTVNSSETFVIKGGPTVAFGGAVILNGSLTNNTNTTINGTLAINNGGIFTNNQSTTANSGITVNTGGTLTNSSVMNTNGAVVNSGTLTNTNNSALTFNNLLTLNSGGIFTNNGTTVSGAITVNNGGTLTNSRVMAASGAVATGGTLTNSNNSTLTFNSLLTVNSGGIFTNSGTTAVKNNLTVNSGGSVTNKDTLTTAAITTVTFDGSASPAALMTNTVNGNFYPTGTTFIMGDSTTVTNNGVLTAANCTFNISGTAASLVNSGTYTDHASVYTLSGQNCSILNKGAGTVMFLRGVAISTTTNNNQTINNKTTLTADSASSISLGGKNSNIINTGTFNAGTSGSKCTITLSGQNSNIDNSAVFNIGATSVIYPNSSTATITNTSPGIFTLKSDATGSAAIGAFTNGALCVGNFNVERFITGGTGRRGYRFLSSPVYTNTVGGNNIYSLNYVKNSSFITGTGGVGGGFDKGGNPTLYLYRENIDNSYASFTSGNFRGVYDINNTPNYTIDVDGGPFNVPVGSGFLFFFRGDRNAPGQDVNTETIASYVPTNTTLTATGAINQGDIDAKTWYSGSLDLKATNTGFFFAGNPYPCSIDLNNFGTTGTAGISAAHIFPFAWIFNPITRNYGVYDINNQYALNGVSNIIASGQGFFVQADTTGPATFKFTEAAKVTNVLQTPGVNLMMGTAQGQNIARQLLLLRLFADSVNYDDIAVGFSPDATPTYSKREDSQYLQGSGAAEGLASFSADSAAVPLSINFLPLPKKKHLFIRLKVDAANSGWFTLKKLRLDKLPKVYELWLIDRYKKDSLDLRNNDSYAFEINKNDTATYGNHRFRIVVRQNKDLKVHLLDFAASKKTDEVPLVWKTENEENYTNFTVERSTDNGVTFNILGGLVSNAQGVYTLNDKNPVKTVDIYRLKLEDLDGDITYSKWITVVYDPSKVITAKTKINVYPNPSKGAINIAISQPGFATGPGGPLGSNPSPAQIPVYAIKIISVTGSVIKSAKSTSPDWQDNVSDLAPGTYFIQVVNNSDNSLVGKSSFVKL